MNASLDSAASPPVRAKRRILLIKRGIQVKFIFLVLVSVLASVILMDVEIYYVFGHEIVQKMMDPGLYQIFSRLLGFLIIKLSIYLVGVGLIALLVSHRFAGPIYRFEKSAQTVARGDLTHRVLLRKRDDLKDLQDEFNNMVISLQESVSKDVHLARRISKQLQEILSAKDVSPEDVSKRLGEIKAEVDHIGTGFKI